MHIRIFFSLPSCSVSRNNGVPPAPPTFSVAASTPSSITLSWSAATRADGGSPILAYRLHYRRQFGDWERAEVPPEMTRHTLNGLRCGTSYQFYIQAVNDFGVGERTDTVSARTAGTAPIAPTDAQALIRANSTSISLNLRAWQSGGCPISR